MKFSKEEGAELARGLSKSQKDALGELLEGDAMLGAERLANCVSVRTLRALDDRGLVRVVRRRSPPGDWWTLTDAGKAAARALEPPPG